MSVRSGSQWADGSGRLAGNRGGGAWRGEGSSGSCDGTWVAERRGFDDYASETSVPRTVVAQAHVVANGNAAYCEAHFKSYDRATGTYLGYDGARHPVPLIDHAAACVHLCVACDVNDDVDDRARRCTEHLGDDVEVDA